ncbi:hypothetical protein DFQ27_006240 [Actinomortierella ambigua]|uniref:Nucleoprotein TPR/MLP1 domain-containing protein n=1 Tax=Actinomortierella ambigua TaxID=1343610 RepID=A0A9P6QH08_9FUNG|nr:hypothetical protein DFQ27_006240 [Actinomortierella ambigua]
MSTPSDATTQGVEGVAPPLTDEVQKDRLAKFLLITQAEFVQLFQQLQSQDSATLALQRLVKQLDVAQGESELLKNAAEEAKAKLSNAEINIDQRLQQSEAKINVFKTQLTNTKQKLAAATKEKDDANAKASELESKLAAQQSGSMHAGVELESLKSKIESIEIEKRDALAMVERKGTELDQMNEDYQRLNERYLETKKEASTFESDYRATKASEMAHTLHKQTLEQELELRTQQLEWAKSELEAKSKELVDYRNEKNTQILKLQGELDKTNLNSTTADQSNVHLQRRVRELETKLVETLQKVKEQKDQSEEKEEQFRIDIENQRRLGSLWEESAIASKARVADLDHTVDELQMKMAQKDAAAQEAIEKLAEEKTQLQIKVEESAVEIEKLKESQKRADELLAQAGLVDAEGISGFGRLGILSPTAAVAGRALKSGMSLTQVYTEYMNVLEEKAALKMENQRLQDSLDDIIEELSNGAPMIRNQQLEYQRLREHAEGLSAQLEESNSEKRDLALGAQEALTQLDVVVKERDMLHKENQDLDRQVQNLLWRIKAPNAPQSLAPETTQPQNNGPLTDAEKVIEDHLVLFSNVQELQQQNKQLRQIARELTKKVDDLDGAEAQEKRKAEQDVMEEVERTIIALQDEVRVKNVEIASYKQEVDMLRRTLKSHNVRGVPLSKIGAPATSDNISAGVATTDPNGAHPSTPLSSTTAVASKETTAGGEAPSAAQGGDTSELARLLAETQKSYDAYRQETSQDMKTLREQLSQAQAENSDFRIHLGRANTQVEVMDERYKLILQNNEHMSTEMSELRKRLTSIQETATRHEIENQRISTELFSYRESAGRLNAEINNLKAEKAIWKSFETRLIEENKSLGKEKGHLSDLLTSIQSMANELERTKEQSKRRHENAMASKEQEVESLKAKLKEETEHLQRVRDRKETEGKEHQAKIDSLTTEYQSAREQYIAAKTTLEHTNAKVEDLTQQLKSKEEQLAIYQHKPAGSDSQETTREEMLETQVKQLQVELARKQEELEVKSKHVAQYQAISQTAEERLAEHMASSEEAKKAFETMEAENTATIKSLEAKLAAAEERAESTANELTAAQTKLDEETSAWFKEKEALMQRLRALEKIEQQMASIESRYRHDLRVQAAAAKEAHENYERELLNHAKDMQALTASKKENAALNAHLAKQKSAADSAVANLQSAELSWESQKNTLQKSMAELEKRCAELKEQNDKLHSHLEDVSSQAMSIQQHLSAPLTTEGSLEGDAANAEQTTAAAVRGSLEHQNAELRDVIRFVRREKDIEAHKNEMSQQENKRLKMQLDQVNRSLEEARMSLMEERNRQQDSMFNKQEYERLLEKVNQYNLVFESNTQLRAEKKRLENKVQDLERKLLDHKQQMEPMKIKLRQLESDLENTTALLKQTSEDRDRWRSRNAEIMAKYDRIDPTEFQELKDAVAKHESNEAEYKTKVAELEASKTELTTKYEALTTKVTELESSVTEEREKTNRAMARTKQVNKAAIEWRTKALALEEVSKKVPELESKLSEATRASGNNETLQKELEDLKKENETHKTESESFKNKFEDAKKKYHELGQKYRNGNARIRELEAQKIELEKKTAEGGGAAAGAGVDAAVEAAVKAKEAELEAKHAAELSSLKANGPSDAAISEARAKSEKELEDLRKEVSMKMMRNSLIVQAKDKEIAKLKELLSEQGADSTAKQATVASGNNTNVSGSESTASTPPATPAAALSVSASAFRPRGVNNGTASPVAAPGSPSMTPARPPGAAAVRPTPANQALLLRQQQQQQQQAAPTPAGAQTLPARPGQSRLRPPLAERLAAAQRGAGAQKVAAVAPVGAAQAAAPAPAAASAAPLALTPVTPTADAATGARAISIKRRREGELPGRVPSPVTAAATGATGPTGAAGEASTAAAAAPAAATPAATAGGATDAQDARSPPVMLKRPRARPASADGTTAATFAAAVPAPGSSAALASAADQTAEGTSGHRVTLRRNRVTNLESETPPGSPPTSATATMAATTTTTTTVAAAVTEAGTSGEAVDAGSKTAAPHGLKRRHETSENTVQESITIVSTPGASGHPEDVEEEMVDVTVTASSESTAMEVDDVPPVKRLRPSSHVTIEELADENNASAVGTPLLQAPESGGSAPGTPSQFDTLDDDEAEAVAPGAPADEAQENPVTPGATGLMEDEGELDDGHHAGEDGAVEAAVTGDLEEELDEGDDLAMAGEHDVEEGEMAEDVDAGDHHHHDDTEEPALLDE